MLENLIWFLAIGLIAGWLAGRVFRGRGFGLIGNLVIGIIGAFIGGWLFDVLHLAPLLSLLAPFVVAFVGALVLLFVLNLIRR